MSILKLIRRLLDRQPGKTASSAALSGREADDDPRQADEQHHPALEGMRNYAIFMLDPGGRVANWNSGAADLTGYAAQEIVGQHYYCFFTPEQIAQGRPDQLLEKAAAHGHADDNGWRVRKDGSRFYVSTLLTALRDPAGALRGFVKVTRDVTERPRTEEMLHSVVDHVLDGIITIDTRGSIESFNPAAEKIFGYAAAEVIGCNVSMLMPEPYHSEHDGYLANYLRTGDRQIIGIGREVFGRRKDASTFPMDLAVSEFTLGSRRLFTGIVRDITERERLQQDLRRGLDERAQAEERMRSVVNHVIDAIISIDEQGIISTFNPAPEKLFGHTAEEIIGQNVKILMPEPDRGRHDDYISNYVRTGNAKIIGIGREVIGQRKDGSTFPMELAISAFRLGERRHFTGIVRDITERKRAEEELRRAEERMRSVVDHVVDGIITIDHRGNVQSMNPAAEKLFGHRREAVMGRNVKMLMPEPYVSQHDAYIDNYLRTGKAKIIGIGREVVGSRSDGSTFPMELAVSEFRIGKHRYFTGIVRDITERKRLEEELRERLEELRTADRQKNEFLAMLAHELRNPLAPMRNALHIMKMPGADAAIADRSRDMMERQLHHLVRLVDDLLDVSRIISGKIDLRRQPMELTGAVERAIETAHPILEARGHTLQVELPHEPVWLDADLVRLAQVIANLLTNAAKYTEHAGQIRLTVEREGETVVLGVRDPGIGLAPEMLSRIFDVFVQADPSLARSQGGLGIGLTLVKRVVEMHGGTIEVRSAGLGLGSEFVVRLPALALNADVLAAETAGPRAHVTDALRRRVLVVDDNVDAADSITSILRLSGYDVRCVYDGLSALDAAGAYLPDVVVLDIGLPGLDGYEVARRLRAQPRFARTPIVAVTGYGQESDRNRARDAGFDAHLTKPVDPAALQAFIASGARH
jgi:PAS domain S-box-containing protein